MQLADLLPATRVGLAPMAWMSLRSQVNRVFAVLSVACALVRLWISNGSIGSRVLGLAPQATWPGPKTKKIAATAELTTPHRNN